MKVLVTGARGQVAQSLVERAQSRPEIELIAAGRPDLDLERPGSAEKIIAAIVPDVVINAAAFTAVDAAESDPKRAFRINADGAGEIAAAAAAIDAPVVQLSTDYVFDGRSAGAYDEGAAPNPLNVYGRSKLAGEEQVRAANPRHLIVRTAWLYGPFGRNFVKTVMDAAGKGSPLTVVDDQHGSPTSTLDLADGLLALLESWMREPGEGLGETFHLAGSGTTTWFRFAEAIMDERRKRGLPVVELRPIASADWPAGAIRPANSALNSCRFGEKFGYALPHWSISLPQIIDRLCSPALKVSGIG